MQLELLPEVINLREEQIASIALHQALNTRPEDCLRLAAAHALTGMHMLLFAEERGNRCMR